MSNWTRETLPQDPGCPLCRLNVPHERHVTVLELAKLGLAIGGTVPVSRP